MSENQKFLKRVVPNQVPPGALLLCDAGEHGDPWKVADIATALGVTSRRIEHLKKRFVEEGLEASLVRKPRDVIFDGAFEARITTLACSKPPDGCSRSKSSQRDALRSRIVLASVYDRTNQQIAQLLSTTSNMEGPRCLLHSRLPAARWWESATPSIGIRSF